MWCRRKRKVILQTANGMNVCKVTRQQCGWTAWIYDEPVLLLDYGKVIGPIFVYRWFPFSGWRDELKFKEPDHELPNQ